MITIDGRRLVDAEGRTLILRGVNLGGSSKVPACPDGATHLREGFFDHRLRSAQEFSEKYAYIGMNPVRKGLSARPEDWPHVIRWSGEGRLV